MKALTLHQPWASLIEFGVKTIETRSWSTSYRERLAIHAGKRTPSVDECLVLMSVLENQHAAPALCWGNAQHSLPFGAVVASCVLADVVPIERHGRSRWEDDRAPVVRVYDDGRVMLWPAQPEDGSVSMDWRHITDQAPFGDFTPGRFAWLLEDVKPTRERCPACWYVAPKVVRYAKVDRGDPVAVLDKGPERVPWQISGSDPECAVCRDAGKRDPIPATGHQGLWEWTP